MILVTFALPFEGAIFEKWLGSRAQESLRAELAVIYLGMGPIAARAGIIETLRSHPDTRAVICAGFAGGLRPGWEVGEVTIATNRTDPAILGLLRASNPAERFSEAQLISVSEPVGSAVAKAALGHESGADLVDMETAAVFDVCHDRGIPILAVRVVSDDVRTDLPLPPNSAPEEPPKLTDLLRHLLGDPRRIPRFIRFVVGCLAARRTLAQAIARLVPAVKNHGQNLTE